MTSIPRLVLCSTLVLVSGQASAATAYWTGQVRYVTTVTYQQGVSCEYSYAGRNFWQTFANTASCPSSIEVQ